MGMCQPCKQQSGETKQKEIVLVLPADEAFNNISLEFTNKSIVKLQGKCLFFYADKNSQLKRDEFLRKLDLQTKRKFIEYFEFADKQLASKEQSNCLVPIDIPKVDFTYLMMIRVEPWDGESKSKMKSQISELTDVAFKALQSINIEEITIVEFDQFTGVHYSMSSDALYKSILRNGSLIRKVTFICVNTQSVRSFYNFFKQSQKQIDSEQQLIKSGHTQGSVENSVYF